MKTMYDPFAPDVLADPYPHYRRLRDESPCHFVEKHGFWVLSRYSDIVAALRNPTVFSSTGGVGPAWAPHPMLSMYDPPEHTRLRKLVARHFTPAALDPLIARMEGLATERLMPALERGEIEVVEELAIPVAIGAMADIIGMPRDRDHDLRRWAVATTDQLAGGLPPERKRRADEEIREFVSYIKELVQLEPHDTEPGVAHGILSHLRETAGTDRLTQKELLAFLVLLLAAGFGTTAIGIANCIHALASFPDEWRRLHAEPQLVPNATEEAIRWDGPVQSFFRNTVSDVEIASTVIPAESKVMILFASANRDEREFEDADAFKIDRMCEHVAYGAGIHYCLGAPLARIVMAAVVRALLRHTRELAINGVIEREPSVLFRTVTRMPLAVKRLDTTRGASVAPPPRMRRARDAATRPGAKRSP